MGFNPGIVRLLITTPTPICTNEIQTISITGATGIGPYDIYLCNTTLSYCYMISGSTTLPITFNTPPIFSGSTSLIVKIVDLIDGCETFQLYSCNCPTPTPTPSFTPTPTQAPVGCRCIEFSNFITEIGYYNYVDCNGTFHNNQEIFFGITYYVCGLTLPYGLSPSASTDVHIYIGDACVDGSCMEPTPTPTPSITPTTTITATPTPTPSFTPV